MSESSSMLVTNRDYPFLLDDYDRRLRQLHALLSILTISHEIDGSQIPQDYMENVLGLASDLAGQCLNDSDQIAELAGIGLKQSQAGRA